MQKLCKLWRILEHTGVFSRQKHDVTCWDPNPNATVCCLRLMDMQFDNIAHTFYWTCILCTMWKHGYYVEMCMQDTHTDDHTHLEEEIPADIVCKLRLLKYPQNIYKGQETLSSLSHGYLIICVREVYENKNLITPAKRTQVMHQFGSFIDHVIINSWTHTAWPRFPWSGVYFWFISPSLRGLFYFVLIVNYFTCEISCPKWCPTLGETYLKYLLIALLCFWMMCVFLFSYTIFFGL